MRTKTIIRNGLLLYKFPCRSLPVLGPVEFDFQGDKWAFERIVKHEKNKRNGVVKYWVKWEEYGDN